MRFAKYSGLILKVGQYGDKDGVMKIECDLFSCFTEEQETLFFGGNTVLKIKGILQWAKGQWRKYDKYMEPINALIRMINGLSMAGQPITSKKSSQRVMKAIVCDVLRTLSGDNHDSKTPKYIQDLVMYHLTSASCVRLLYHELITEYQWLDCILKSGNSNTLNIANIAVLLSHSDEVTFMMPADVPLSVDWDENILSLWKMELDVIIRCVWPSTVPQNTVSQFTYFLQSNTLWNTFHGQRIYPESLLLNMFGSNFNELSEGLYESRMLRMIQCLTPIRQPVAGICAPSS